MTDLTTSTSATIRLGALAHARSGDKGNRANIGVVADDGRCYDWLERHLTADAVAGHLGPLGVGEVVRYALPKIRAFNFVIERALSGGASRSLRLDTQGKALGVALLELELPPPPWHAVGGESPMSTAEALVTREDRGPVAILTLNRPERRNALSRALIAALGDALDAIEPDPAIRAVVLTGTGTVFCAGMDLKEATALEPGPEAERKAVADAQAIADLIQQVHTFPRPVVAALNGPALGGGAGLALACDFIVADETAEIGYPEVLRGLVAAIVVHDLVRQVGDRRARELLLTGEPIDAEVAREWGLFKEVHLPGSFLEGAVELADSLVESAPQAIATIKRLIDEATNRPADLRGAAAVSASVRVGDEAAEGMRAFLEKRPPRWAATED